MDSEFRRLEPSESRLGQGRSSGEPSSGTADISRSRGPGEGTQTSSVRVDANGNLIYSESVTESEGGPGGQGRGQRLYSNSSGSVFYDANLNNPASDEAQQIADQIQVNVQVGDETVDAVTSTSENRRGSE